MSQKQSGYARKERDLYETPAWVTRALLPHLRPLSAIWEPACGSGQMVDVLKSVADVMGTDIDKGRDFLFCVDGHFHKRIDAIITNPPYELAGHFCDHAVRLMERIRGVVAMLLRTDFDHAKSRAHLFRDCSAFAKKIVLTKRIVWFVDPATGKPKKSPSENHAWFVWDWKHEGPPTIAYGP